MRSLDRSFGAQGLLDVVRDRQVALVRGSDKLQQWTNQNIHPTAVFGPGLGLRPPYIVLATQSVGQETQPGAKGRQTVRTLYEIVLEEPIGILKVGAVSIGAVYDELLVRLYSDQLLKDSDGLHLTEKLLRVELFDMKWQTSDGGIELHYFLTAVHWLDRNVFTQEQFARA